jgi:hypothetical protein
MSAFPMNWKSTAGGLGVTLLAGWLGISPSLQPAPTPAAVPRGVAPVGTDIEAQAERLQLRVRTEMEYRDPTRNPFRFNERRAAPVRGPVAATAPLAVEAAPSIQPLPFVLSGMASDGADAERTAILTTAADVLFARTGDQVAGYTVTRVDDTGIEVTAADGSVRRLPLTP